MQVVVDTATSVAAGDRHSMILKQDGSVYIWTTGHNKYVQLAAGSVAESKVFAGDLWWGKDSRYR